MEMRGGLEEDSEQWWAPPAVYSNKGLILTIFLVGHEHYTTGVVCSLDRHDGPPRTLPPVPHLRPVADKRKTGAFERREATLVASFSGTDCRTSGLTRAYVPPVTRVHASGSSSTCAPADKRNTGACKRKQTTLAASFSIVDLASGLSCACTTTIRGVRVLVLS